MWSWSVSRPPASASSSRGVGSVTTGADRCSSSGLATTPSVADGRMAGAGDDVAAAIGLALVATRRRRVGARGPCRDRPLRGRLRCWLWLRARRSLPSSPRSFFNLGISAVDSSCSRCVVTVLSSASNVLADPGVRSLDPSLVVECSANRVLHIGMGPAQAMRAVDGQHIVLRVFKRAGADLRRQVGFLQPCAAFTRCQPSTR